MPTYEYKCKECGHCFDVVHGVHDNVESCELCGSNVRRVFHPVGVIFKGSGFYSTDNRSKSSNGGKSAGTTDTGAAEQKADESKAAGTDKPAEKTEKAGSAEKSGSAEKAGKPDKE